MDKLVTDNITATIASITYQGPAGTLYLYAGVAQPAGGSIVWTMASPQSVNMPAASSPTAIPVNIVVTMAPVSNNPPQVGVDTQGVIAVFTDAALTNRIATFSYPSPYNVISGVQPPPVLQPSVSNITVTWG